MEKVVIENGGRMMDDENQSMYLIQEDGYDPNIWK
jgi:hypothetical protein